MLTLRGIPDRTIQRLFAKVGAKWDWTTDEKRAARRDSDHGVAVLDPKGPGVVLDSTLRRRDAEQAKRIRESDQKATNRARSAERDAKIRARHARTA